MIASFAGAISQATVEAMDLDPNIVILGIGPNYSSGIFGTTSQAFEKFGKVRVIDTPAMENGLTGIVLGASIAGLKPILIHARNDFMFLALDQTLNAVAKWRYMFNGNSPQNSIVIRAIVGRGWGQGATHSQNLASTLAHYPGIKVMLPSFPADAGGMLKSALNSSDPVVIIEHRSLFELKGQISNPIAETPLFGVKRVCAGKDLTIISTSVCTQEVLEVKDSISNLGISLEIIDLRSITPIDILPIVDSVKKTKRLLVIEPDWTPFGIGSEICAQLMEKLGSTFSFNRMGHPYIPAPTSQSLEPFFYTSPQRIFNKIIEIFDFDSSNKTPLSGDFHDHFKGPY